MSGAGRRVLVLGGARSGKSAFAEELLRDRAAVEYVATGQRADSGADGEWAERIAAHRARRPAHWSTIETQNLTLVYGDSHAVPALIDSITAWLTAVLDSCGAWQARPGWKQTLSQAMDQMVEAWRGSARELIAVSDEVGGGIVPESVSARLFRDELGSLNQRLAAASDEVWLITAGLGQKLR